MTHTHTHMRHTHAHTFFSVFSLRPQCNTNTINIKAGTKTKLDFIMASSSFFSSVAVGKTSKYPGGSQFIARRAPRMLAHWHANLMVKKSTFATHFKIGSEREMNETVTGWFLKNWKVFWSPADTDPPLPLAMLSAIADGEALFAGDKIPPLFGIMQGNTNVFVIWKISTVTLPVSLRVTKENDRFIALDRTCRVRRPRQNM